MKKAIVFWEKYALLTLFLLFIFLFSIMNVPAMYQMLHLPNNEKIMNGEDFEREYNDNFWKRLSFVDAQGFIANITGQKIINGIIKGNDGKLNLLANLDYRFVEEEEKRKIKRALSILHHSEEKGAKVLYVQRPWSTGPVPYGFKFELDEQYDFWCNEMRMEDIPVLDLRDEIGDKIEFYTTDHHWTVESSFYANERIIKRLNYLYNLKLDQKELYTDIRKYKKINYENSFLGSEGIRTGKFFVGKDDFEIIVPLSDTLFTYTQYRFHEVYWEAKGSYEEVFIDKEKLEDLEYNNKYNTITYDGYVENRIINHLADNNMKVMLIADSFARPMVTYLAENFKETRYLDPQDGRYNESYIEYIDEYKPDVVIMMFPGDGVFKKI